MKERCKIDGKYYLLGWDVTLVQTLTAKNVSLVFYEEIHT